MVAVDGSDQSEIAFQYVYRDMMKNDKVDVEEGVQDTLVCGSITHKQKESYLPYNMKSQYLTDLYDAKVLPLGTHGRCAFAEVDTAKGTKECLWELAEF